MESSYFHNEIKNQGLCLKLIELIKQHPVLWTFSSKKTLNANRKVDAWRNIAREMGKSEEMVRKKWLSLCAYYRKEKAKVKKTLITGSACTDVYNSNWFAFDSMHFLGEITKPRPTQSTMTVNRRINEVWTCFVRMDKTSYKCKMCQRVMLVKQKSSFSLKRHLDAKHPTWKSTSSEWLENQDEEQFDSSMELASNHAIAEIRNLDTRANTSKTVTSQTDIDKKLLKVFCDEALPFHLVESHGFRDFITMLCPSYNLPAYKTLSNDMLNAGYQELLEAVKFNLSNAKAVALTTENWTDSNNDAYLAVTAHYIDDRECIWKSHFLECVQFEESHTAQNIVDWLNTVKEFFDIDNKVTCVVTASETNMKSAANLMDIEHMPCFAQIINLAVGNAIKVSIHETVDKVKRIVNYYKRSTAAPMMLRKIQQNANHVELKLVLDVPTRWHTTFSMIQRFLINKESILCTLALLEENCSLEEKDWNVMEQAVNVLRVLDAVTQELSAEKNVTLSKMHVIVRLLLSKLTTLNRANFSEEVGKLIDHLMINLNECFSYLSKDVIGHATILDPRFKKKGFEYECDFDKRCMSLTLQMEKLRKDPKIEHKHFADREEPTSDGVDSIWDEFDTMQQNTLKACRRRNSNQIELDNYLAIPFIHRKDDPFEWWKLAKSHFPTLYKAMLRTLCIPASSVPCEWVFTEAGELEIINRNRLSASKRNKILFTKYNQK